MVTVESEVVRSYSRLAAIVYMCMWCARGYLALVTTASVVDNCLTFLFALTCVSI